MKKLLLASTLLLNPVLGYAWSQDFLASGLGAYRTPEEREAFANLKRSFSQECQKGNAEACDALESTKNFGFAYDVAREVCKAGTSGGFLPPQFHLGLNNPYPNAKEACLDYAKLKNELMSYVKQFEQANPPQRPPDRPHLPKPPYGMPNDNLRPDNMGPNIRGQLQPDFEGGFEQQANPDRGDIQREMLRMQCQNNCQAATNVYDSNNPDDALRRVHECEQRCP